jgi:LytS/YehU family sensor histidine kinase
MFILVIMMFGANLGVKTFCQNEEEKKHLAKLKEQSLKQELDYLRYQINPHFIMNTLNNIHALVDIDPELAKDSIVDMSRMMRYLLYESDNNCVSLSSAILFLKKYLNLMKLRYMDAVNINLDVPSSCGEDVALVPLVFIPFVENAFKHGVGIDKPSTIDIDIKHEDGRLLFHCHNTKSGVKHEYGGVGLNNVTKRLELIYGNDYKLDINDGDDTYDVMLDLPFRYPSDFQKTKD